MRSPSRRSVVVAVAGTLAICASASAALVWTSQHPSHAIHVAQVAAGTGNGSSCANARPVDWFNDRRNWGRGRGMIGPGITVALCGTIRTSLVAHGSGQPGRPITIQFERNAALSQPVCPGRGTGCLSTNRQTYLRIDGGANGAIRSTANGTNLANHADNVVGIWALDCTGCAIEHLTIGNMYVHVYSAAHLNDDAANTDDGIFVSGRNVSIAHNTLHDLRTAIDADWNATDSGGRIYDNDIYNIDGGILVSPQQSGGAIGPIYIYANHIHDFANWDTVSDAFHHDGLHCFTSETTNAPAHYRGLYIYGNTFGGKTDTGLYGDRDNMTAQIFLQGSGSTQCADDTSPIYIFNNVLSASYYINDGLIDTNSGVPYVINNTMIGPEIHDGATFSTGDAVVNGVFENNLLTTAHSLMYMVAQTNGQARPFASGSLSHNLYAHGGSNAFICGSNYFAFRQFARWRACIRGDRASRTVADARLASDGSPTKRSPARGVGTNLSSLCTGSLRPLCSDIRGHSRPDSGAWTAGAYQ
jgi:hypothetical protein